VTGVENVNLSIRNIPAIGFRFREVERRIILTPDHEQPRLPFGHPGLPLGIPVHVRAVVVEEVALNIGLPGLAKEGKFVGPQIRVIAIDIGIGSKVARSRRRER